MDHKVSKDMISSGMIPSGEKTQADLGKTQYGSAPSPSKLMDAYKSMYDKKEEVINEMKMGDVSGSADFASRNIKGAKGAAPVPKKETGITPYKSKEILDKDGKSKETGITPYKKPETKSMVDTVKDRRKEVVSDRRERVQKIMNKYGESVDLLAAYRSIYEHHKKDADGNTIPHEHEEELDEGKIPAGLQAYLDKKKGKKEDKKEMKEGMGLYANIHAKRKRGGKMRKKGDKGAPSSQDFANAAKTAKEEVERDNVKEFVERVAGMPPTNEMGKVMFGKEAKDFYKAQKSKRKPFEPVKPKRKPFEPVTEEKVTNIMNKMGESADLFDIVSTYFIEEGYDKKDIYAAMSSIDLSEKVQDLHEVLPIIAKAGAMLGKLGAATSKGFKAMKTGAGNLMSKIKPSGIKSTPSGTAKVTSSGGKIEQGGGPTSLLGKAKEMVKKNPMTSYMVARDMTSGGGGSAAGQTRTSSISASADLFDIVKGQLLDEGLSEEEIKDIMLTLTPDEIMSEMAVNPNIKAMDAKNKADMIARAKAKEVPQNIRDASKRQMKAGTPREDPKNPYTSDDRETIKNYYSKND